MYAASVEVNPNRALASLRSTAIRMLETTTLAFSNLIAKTVYDQAASLLNGHRIADLTRVNLEIVAAD